MKFADIVKSIETLAPLSDAIINIQRLYADTEEDFDISRLVAYIESDAVLSLHILKMANSPVYGFATRIASISQAVTLFGIMQVYGFVMQYAMSGNLKANTEIFGFSNERFNDICTMQSALLLQWYSKIDTQTARLLAPLALMMEIGKLVLASELRDTPAEKAFAEGFKKTQDIQSYEINLLGKSSYAISAAVFEHWHLERLYILVLQSLDTQEQESESIQLYGDILRVVSTAVNVKSMLSKTSVSKACLLLQKMGLDTESFVQFSLKIKRAYIDDLQTRKQSDIQ